MAGKLYIPTTIVQYPVSGVDYRITFEYLARRFVKVILIKDDLSETILELNTDYRFTTPTQITLNEVPVDYKEIRIRRVTSATDRLVDYHDGSILRAYDLNLAQIQSIHVSLEARDSVYIDGLAFNEDNDYDAKNHRIVNLADPIDELDAVNLKTVKTLTTEWAAGSKDRTASITINASYSNDFQTYNLKRIFGLEDDIEALTVFINGVLQEPILAYNINEDTCVFTEQLDRSSRITFILANIVCDTLQVSPPTEKTRITHIATMNQERFIAPAYNMDNNELIVSIQGVVQAKDLNAYKENTPTEIIISEPLPEGTIVEIYRIK